MKTLSSGIKEYMILTWMYEIDSLPFQAKNVMNNNKEML